MLRVLFYLVTFLRRKAPKKFQSGAGGGTTGSRARQTRPCQAAVQRERQRYVGGAALNQDIQKCR
jgi:hypothetical protein